MNLIDNNIFYNRILNALGIELIVQGNNCYHISCIDRYELLFNFENTISRVSTFTIFI